MKAGARLIALTINSYDVAAARLLRLRGFSRRRGPRRLLPVGAETFPTGEPYEGGIVSEGSARVRFSVRYYLIAMFFVVFDLEAVFLFAWAGAARELGWSGYFGLLLFVGLLGAALIYLWRSGALDWSNEPKASR